jgi:uncharacterized protein (DUF983 family)
MSTMPPGEPPPTPPRTTTTSAWGNMPDMARPIPGNAEFLFYVVLLIFVSIVCWISDHLGAPEWLEFAKWVSVAYLLSRGIAKASRVLEQ